MHGVHFFFFCSSSLFYSPAQLERGLIYRQRPEGVFEGVFTLTQRRVIFTLSDLLDKPWSRVPSFPPPARAFIFIEHRIHFSIPTFELYVVDYIFIYSFGLHRITPTHALIYSFGLHLITPTHALIYSFGLHRITPTHALALSACRFVSKKSLL